MFLVFTLSGTHDGRPVYSTFCKTQTDMISAVYERAIRGKLVPAARLPDSCRQIETTSADVDPTMAGVVVVTENRVTHFAYGYRPHTLSDGTSGYLLVIQFIIRT